LAVILLAALLPLANGTLFGFAADGVDLPYHVGSWVDMVQAWKSGVILPGWAAHANYGLGDPRLYFYPPVSRFLGAILTAALPAAMVLPVYFWLLYSLAGLTMYRLSSLCVEQSLRLPAALLYMLSYFMLVKSIHYAAMAELLCDALLPLLLYYVIRYFQGERRGAWVIPNLFAIFILTDVPLAIGSLYLLSAVAILLAWPARTWKTLLAFWALEILGVLEAAFYLLPASSGRKTIVSTGALFYHLDFLFSVHTGLARTASLYMVAGAVFLLYRLRRAQQGGVATRLLLWSALGCFFLQLILSKPLWLYLPEFYVIGFPERMQVFMFLAIPLIFLSTRPSALARRGVYAIYLLLGMLLPVATFLQVRHFQPRSITDLFHQSEQESEGVPEYLTTGTGAMFIDHNRAPYAPGPAHVQHVDGQCQVKELLWAPQARKFAVDGEGCDLTLRLFEHPYWQLRIDGQAAPDHASSLGLLQFRVPAGAHTAVLEYAPPQKPFYLGLLVSIVAFALSFTGRFTGRFTGPLPGLGQAAETRPSQA
jgi:hypothetical protein